MERIHNLTFSSPVNTFIKYMIESSENQQADEEDEIPTIDGNIISQVALDSALKTGSGFMIGGFFVGANLGNDLPSDYARKI